MKWLRSRIARHLNWITGLIECARLVAKMERMLYQANAPNFMTAYTRTPAGEKFEITLRRVEGKSVSEVLNDARAERDTAIAMLASFAQSRVERGEEVPEHIHAFLVEAKGGGYRA